MEKVHFEIGHLTTEIQNGKQVTESVFSSSTFTECLKEFKEKGYNTREYFIDVWEKDKNGASYPLAEINIDEFYFNHYCE